MHEPTAQDEVEGRTITDVAAAVAPSGAAAKLAAPVLALAATWGVRHVMDRAYRRSTGSPPPRAGDPEVPLGRVLMWAAASAAVLAVTNVVIDRLTARWGQ